MRSNNIPAAYVDTERCLIVDVDGTLTIRGDRDPHDLTLVGEDKPNAIVLDVVKSLWRTKTWNYVIISGRQEIARHDTREWLKRHGLWYASGLIMRADKDNRSDAIVKRELFEAHIKPHWLEFLVLDDRDSVVSMWRNELEIPCWQVNYGDF